MKSSYRFNSLVLTFTDVWHVRELTLKRLLIHKRWSLIFIFLHILLFFPWNLDFYNFLSFSLADAKSALAVLRSGAGVSWAEPDWVRSNQNKFSDIWLVIELDAWPMRLKKERLCSQLKIYGSPHYFLTLWLVQIGHVVSLPNVNKSSKSPFSFY